MLWLKICLTCLTITSVRPQGDLPDVSTDDSGKEFQITVMKFSKDSNGIVTVASPKGYNKNRGLWVHGEYMRYTLTTAFYNQVPIHIFFNDDNRIETLQMYNYNDISSSGWKYDQGSNSDDSSLYIDEDCLGKVVHITVSIEEDKEYVFIKLENIEKKQYASTPQLLPILMNAMFRDLTVKLVTRDCFSEAPNFDSVQFVNDDFYAK